MEIITRQIRKRAAFLVALNRMPMREQINERIAIPVSRSRRRSMAWAVARRVLAA